MAALALIVALCAGAFAGTHAKRAEVPYEVNYQKAKEYPDSWTRVAELEAALAAVAARVKQIEDKVANKTLMESAFLEDEKMKMMESAFLGAIQRLMVFNRLGCEDMCAICVPDAKKMAKRDDVHLKSFFIERSKSWVNKSKMILAGPADEIGTYQGRWTDRSTECSRVGFDAFVNGESEDALSFRNVKYNRIYGLKTLRQAMHYDKKWYKQQSSPTENGLDVGDKGAAQTSKNYAAISHCEFMRLRKFDVRHVLECMKHEMLCGGQALLLPANDAGSCKDKSDAAKLELSATQGKSLWLYIHNALPTKVKAFSFRKLHALSKTWTDDAKEKGACVRLLCKYSGFTQGALQTQPDEVKNKDLTDPEKEALVADFVRMSSCKERFQAADGEELTLNSEEERAELCWAFTELFVDSTLE